VRVLWREMNKDAIFYEIGKLYEIEKRNGE
jgi:hypothetical protein